MFSADRRKALFDILLPLLCLVISAGLLLGTLTVRSGRGDLWVVVKAASDFVAGNTIYVIDENPHTKPPLATLASVPLTWIPFRVLERIWDGLNLLGFLGMAALLFRWLGKRPRALSALAFVSLAILMVENQWNAEVRFGQYNVLLAWLVLLSAMVPSFVAGLCFFLAVLFKPVNLAFGVWAMQQTRSRMQFVLGGVTGALVLVGLFLRSKGAEAFLADHVSWLAFMKEATATMLRWDALNYGIPRLFVDWGVSPHRVAQLSPFATLLVGSLIPLWVGKKERALSFSLVAFVVVVTSPLAWAPNYALLVGYALVLWSAVFEAWTRPGAGWGEKLLSVFAVGALYTGLQLHNPETIRIGLFGPVTPVPLYGALLSLGAFVVLTLQERARSPR